MRFILILRMNTSLQPRGLEFNTQFWECKAYGVYPMVHFNGNTLKKLIFQVSIDFLLFSQGRSC